MLSCCTEKHRCQHDVGCGLHTCIQILSGRNSWRGAIWKTKKLWKDCFETSI